MHFYTLNGVLQSVHKKAKLIMHFNQTFSFKGKLHVLKFNLGLLQILDRLFKSRIDPKLLYIKTSCLLQLPQLRERLTGYICRLVRKIGLASGQYEWPVCAPNFVPTFNKQLRVAKISLRYAPRADIKMEIIVVKLAYGVAAICIPLSLSVFGAENMS